MAGRTASVRRRVMGGTLDLKSIFGAAKEGASGEEGGGTSTVIEERASKLFEREGGGREEEACGAEHAFFGETKGTSI